VGEQTRSVVILNIAGPSTRCPHNARTRSVYSARDSSPRMAAYMTSSHGGSARKHGLLLRKASVTCGWRSAYVRLDGRKNIRQ